MVFLPSLDPLRVVGAGGGDKGERLFPDSPRSGFPGPRSTDIKRREERKGAHRATGRLLGCSSLRSSLLLAVFA
jgi:hypothetical protein